MKLKEIETIFGSLNDQKVRYLVAGGLAVVAHGYLRFTADIDLILDMDPKNLRTAMQVFKSLGYGPRAPVELEDFVDSEMRRTWVCEKGLTVFSLWNPDRPGMEIDLFVDEPIPFEEAYRRNVCLCVAGAVEASFVALDDLITLKRRAGRARDLDDIEKLCALTKAEA
ncbi:MAG: DUF6036 family nucleotidyltransferase [Thermodesulfobacteriota bacterium]